MFKEEQRVIYKHTHNVGTIKSIHPHKSSYYAMILFDEKPVNCAINPAPIHFDGLMAV